MVGNILIVVLALLAALPAYAGGKKFNHTDADYQTGWLQRWTSHEWGPNVYYDRQAGLTCHGAEGHDLPQCFKDSNSDELMIRVSDNEYLSVGQGDNAPLTEDPTGPNPLFDLESACTQATINEPEKSTKRIATLEVEAESANPSGVSTVVNCAVTVRFRVEPGTIMGASRFFKVFIPIYRKGKLVGEVAYSLEAISRHKPGNGCVPSPGTCNASFIDVWDYSTPAAPTN